MSAKTANHIAVTGLACRFPGAPDLDAFGQLLANGASGLSRVAEPDPRRVPVRGQLEDIELFDPALFRLSPSEARILDPQQRLFLENALLALHHGRLDPKRFPGRVACFAAAEHSDYLRLHLEHNPALAGTVSRRQLRLANDREFLASRASFLLGLDGPALNVQAACASGLAAVHLAVQCLLAGEADAALAGAVSLRLPNGRGYRARQHGPFSRDGLARAFDRDSRGTVPGDGVGVVLLRRLDDALADGDAIHAVIRGSALNNDGHKSSYHAPGTAAQRRAAEEALALAELPPAKIAFVEATGIGTRLCDALELEALAAVYGAQRSAPLRVGAVKTQVGHLGPASGMAALIKLVLALQRGFVPATLNYQRPGPFQALESGVIAVNNQAEPWPLTGTRHGAVHCFGVGGTNVHLVLSAAPRHEAAQPLPAPPFQRQRCWIEPPPHQARPNGNRLQPAAHIGDWFYQPLWKQASAQPAAERHGGTCLVFADATPLTQALLERLRAQFDQLFWIEADANYRPPADGRAAIKPGDPAQAERLIEDLSVLGARPDRLIHLWGLADQDPSERGFYSLVALAQALGRRRSTLPGQDPTLALTVLAQGLHRIHGRERLCPEKALVLGACQVIPLEFPGFSCRVVDLEPSETLAEPLAQIAAELGHDEQPSVVAWRGGLRLTPHYEPLSLERQAGADWVRTDFPRPGAVYLITGGLGGIGLNLARFLARTPGVALALIARTPLDEHSERGQSVRELRNLGATVAVYQADVAVRTDMTRALAAIQRELGHPTGVFHCAGLAGGGMILRAERARREAVLAPKLLGTQILAELLAARPPEFMILTSSLNALVGGVGLVDYAAANAFQNAFAAAAPFPTAALILGEAWLEVGMAANYTREAAAVERKKRLKRGITSAQGEALFAALARALPQQLIVSSLPLAERMQRFQAQQGFRGLASKKAVADPLPSLREAWRDFLGHDTFDDHTNFFDLGGDSLMAVHLTRRLRRTLGLDLGPASLLRAPTIAALAALISGSTTKPNALDNLDNRSSTK